MNGKHNKVIVVGGGLSGLSTVHTILQAGGQVILVDKSDSVSPPKCNSSLTISGINGCCSSLQKSQRVDDSVDTFISDIAKNGPKKSELLQLLCANSGDSVDWLMTRFGLPFVLSRSGGHTKARTHQTRDKCTGRAVVTAMAKKAVDVSLSDPSRLTIITNATCSKLVTNDTNQVVGIEYEKEGAISRLEGCVVLCTGGFGADFNTPSSSIARYRPDLLKLSTACNLATTTGDGIALGEQVGARLVDMMYVQLNPTGLVDPTNVGSRFKPLASEALRGDGGIIVDKHGHRFVNELSKRDYLSAELVKNSNGPFRIILNSRMSGHVQSHIDEYLKKNTMKRYESAAELADDMNIPSETLLKTFNEYNQAALEKKDQFGKAHFRNCPFEMADVFHVAIIEPVIQYCVGGLLITNKAEVMGRDGKVISGLFAAGEVTGGIHSNVPLTGNDLLDCIVFGRIAGVTAAKKVYGSDFVDKHLNPALMKEALLETIRGKQEEVDRNRQTADKIRAEIDQVQDAIEAERAEIAKACARLVRDHGTTHPDLAGLKFNPQGVTLEEMLSVGSAKGLAVAIRTARRQAEEDLEDLKRQVEQCNNRVEEIRKEINFSKKSAKQIANEKKKLEKDLHTVRNGSTVIKEIHELENLVATYRQRQEAAESALVAAQKAHDEHAKIHNEIISVIAKKREETEVMIQLEKVDIKRETELLNQVVDKMRHRIESEKRFATKANALASNEACPIFQAPLKRRLVVPTLQETS